MLNSMLNSSEKSDPFLPAMEGIFILKNKQTKNLTFFSWFRIFWASPFSDSILVFGLILLTGKKHKELMSLEYNQKAGKSSDEVEVAGMEGDHRPWPEELP